MARYRYTLKAYHIDTDKEYKIKLKEQGYQKEKVYLTTIDQFILSHITDKNKIENFQNKEEVITYLNQYYGYQIPLDSYLYISYQAEKNEKMLEVVYPEEPVLQYFSHLYTYLYQTKESEKKVKEQLQRDPVWQEFLELFKKNIKNETYYKFIMREEGKNYINSYLKNWIRNYLDYVHWEVSDEQEMFMEARRKIKEQFQYYKVLRGIELSYEKYSKKYHQNIGINRKKMELYLEKQQLSMPMNEPVYFDKHHELPVEFYRTGYEELDDIIGDSATNISELSEQVFEELGLTLEELERYPDLKEKLGFTIEDSNLQNKKYTKRKINE